MTQTNVYFVHEMMVIGVFLALILVLPLWLFYRRYLDLKGVRVLGLLLASLAAMFGTIAYQAYAAEPTSPGLALELRVPVVSAGLLWVVLFPFLLRLYFSWMEGKVTEAQQRPDAEGVRAWLRGGNAVCALGVSLFAWLGFGYPPLVVLLLCVAALLAYPAAILFKQMPESPVTGNETLKTERNTLSTEREKVLAMVESGRISGEEAAELMNALGQAAPNTGDRASSLSAGQKLLLLGGVLVLVGSFCPGSASISEKKWVG